MEYFCLMVSEIKIEEVFSQKWPIIDVRSPGEYDRGHIPNSINIPLFSNDERAQVGTIYKQQSKEAAIKKGYDFVEPNLDKFISQSSKVAPNGKVIIHCWRGGMRSRSFAKHLSNNGFSDVRVIVGGYKTFRNLVLDSLASPFHLKVIGGYTGSGKTHILYELKKQGNQIIDLEKLANHKGSAFGGIGLGKQSTVEQFENNLYGELNKLNLNEPVYIEDESQNIGKIKIPTQFFKQIRSAKLYFIEIPREERAKHLVTEYARCDKELLAESIQNISKRLGGLNTQESLKFLEDENYYEVALISLHYYDKYYLKGMNARKSENVIKIPLPSTNHHENALEIEKLQK